MKQRIRGSIVIFTIACLFSKFLKAQTDIHLMSFMVRDDNAFKNREAYDEWINNSSIYIGHRFAGKTIQLQGYYSADVLNYANNTDLNNYANQFGVTSHFYFDDYMLHIGAYVKLHNYKEQYIYYEVDRYYINCNLQYDPDLANFYSFGLAINKDKYKEFQDLDNLSYRLYGKYQHFFQSKLSITAEAGLGVKNYINQSEIQFFGPGNARNPFARYREDPVKAAQFSLSFNVGKSITPRTGMNLGLGGRWFIGDPIMAYSDGIYYYTENDLYDDPYSFQNSYVSLQITRQFAVGFQGKLGVKFQKKDYAGTPALDENGDLTGETRQDTRDEYFIMITKKFVTGWSVAESFDLFINLMYRNNPSNDPYYKFEDHIVLMGFAVDI
jgi:hypothetical protein